MPAVLVHGVPGAHRVDVVTLSLPGPGCGLPPGFDRTKEAYP